ncbi:MAG: leucine-rich repeat domain-containing protein, partial [Bacteroidaceae bacterium]|nr:leucine-rich repeat domain-containing protein [Bacteroidaceae bacterium]
YAALIGSGVGKSYAYVNMGKIIFTDMKQEELDEVIPTWLPSDFNQYGAYALGKGYEGIVYKCGAFGGVWVSDGNGGTVQIGSEDGYYINCNKSDFVHDFDEICGGTCSDCGVIYFVAHTLGTAATCIAQAVCSVCGESYGDIDADAHNYGDWVSNGDGTHIRTCANDNTHTENGDCSGGTATCTTLAVCDICKTAYGELGAHTAEPTYAPNAGDSTQHDATYSCCGATVTEAHTMDVATGKCVCGADMTAIATVTDGTNTCYAADAATLNQAVTAILETGSRTFTVELPADAPAEMITAIRRAICDTEGVADGSIHLTLKGVTTIPGTNNWDGVAFGPRNAQWDENNVEIVSHEEVTQLASINLPDVTEIGAQAFLDCSKLTSITAPKVQSIGDWGLQGTAITSIDMPLLKEAGFAAFHSTALTEVSLPSLETAGSALFMDCKQLRTVDLPKLQNQKNQLFDRCTSLVSVNVPAATSMSNEVFCDCSELVSITLSGVTELLTYGGFAGCTKLENVTLGSVITKVNANLFDGEALSSNITLTLHPDQANAEGDLKATAGTNVEWGGFTWKEVKFSATE